MINILIEEFSSLLLTVDRIGPFQERMEEFDFTDSNDEPCNAYLMISKMAVARPRSWRCLPP